MMWSIDSVWTWILLEEEFIAYQLCSSLKMERLRVEPFMQDHHPLSSWPFLRGQRGAVD
jgi:hypothetical protein